MKKSLSRKVLVPLIIFTLIPGILLTGLAERLTEDILLDHFLQRGIELGSHMNEEFYDRYFNPRYEIEGKAFNPLAPKHLKALGVNLTDPNAVVEGKLVRRIEGGTTYELQGLADAFKRMVEDIGRAYEQERRLKSQLQLLHKAAMALGADLSLEVVL